MPENPPPERFKAEMPAIPGVSAAKSQRSGWRNPVVRLIGGLLLVLVVVVLIARGLARPKHTEVASVPLPPQIDIPSPVPDPSATLPHASEANPTIAELSDMAKPWSSKEFYFNRPTGDSVPALLLRLPTGTASQPNGYWAFAMTAPFGSCRLEYVTDLDKLRTDYDFRDAKHPMVGDPCSRTLFDPLKMSNLPGNVWVRGAVVQGSDLRPPLGIEVTVHGEDILASRME